MAHNRQPDLKPNYSSSEEDEEEEEEEASGSEDEQTSDSGSEEEASDSDSEPKPKQELKKPVIPPKQNVTKPQAPDLSSSETEESGSDTDSDSPPKKPAVADPNIKPITSKPMEDESKPAKKPELKATSIPSPAKGKRPTPAPANEKEKDAKKAKKTTTTTTDDDSKKQLFQRLWSEDDEIVILKGMIDYKTEKNGENPIADMGAFHEFIKKSLHVDVSRAQLVDKVRRLKKKYVNNASREKNGKDRSFSKSHEQKGYDLSKLIWGNNSHTSEKPQTQKNGTGKSNPNTASTSTVKANGVDEKEGLTMEVEKNMDVSRFVQYNGRSYSPVMEEEIMKAGLELVEGDKREELKEKWNKLKMQELKLFVERMDLVKEQAAVVFEAMNSSGN